VALARGDRASAEHWARAVIAQVDEARSGGPTRSEPYVEWVAWRVLVALRDPRADAWLQQACAGLRRVLDTVDDAELRRGFCDDVPEHREVASAWAASGGN
jgi:uncharacterized protein YfaT (DUF1175 family)